jgi:hypothetical protein
MNSERFINSIQSNLTPLAPVVIPGIIKKQLENLKVSRGNITPSQATHLINNVTQALALFIGPDGSKRARKLMMKKLRENCTNEELEALIVESTVEN